MTSVTVSRNGTSVTFDVYERPGAPHVSRDVVKPAAKIYRTGKDAPRFTDQRAAEHGWTVVGQTVGSDAYADARNLAENIVRAHSGGTAATLDLSSITGLSSYDVHFVGDRALSLHYPPGVMDWVSLQLVGLEVTDVFGGGTAPNESFGSSGNGPLNLKRGNDSVTITDGLDVKRRVGRPASVSRQDTSDKGYAIDRPRAFNDTFEISGVFTTNADTEQSTLFDTILGPPLGYDSLTLDFNGLYGMGEYTVAPSGLAGRASWLAGDKGLVHIDRLRLVVVDNDATGVEGV